MIEYTIYLFLRDNSHRKCNSFVNVPADKAKNNIFFLQNVLHLMLLSDVDVESNNSDKTYTAPRKKVHIHKSVLSSFGLSTKDDDCNLSSMYWIP